jgi:hypothetical protein
MHFFNANFLPTSEKNPRLVIITLTSACRYIGRQMGRLLVKSGVIGTLENPSDMFHDDEMYQVTIFSKIHFGRSIFLVYGAKSSKRL